MAGSYEILAETFGRIAAFGNVGAIVGAGFAAARNERHTSSKASYGEWAAYSAAVVGAIAVGIEIALAV